MKNLRKKMILILGILMMSLGVVVCMINFVPRNHSISNEKNFKDEEPASERIVYLNPEKTISIKIPDSWNYETVEEAPDDVLDAVHLYPNQEQKDQYISIRKTKEPLGVCGTSLTTEKLELSNGQEATIGYYDGGHNWEFINIAGENVFSWNHGLTEQQAKRGIEIIKTIEY